MRYLLKEEIIYLNRMNISRFGGNFMPPSNFLHEENLDYLIGAVEAEMFGSPLYPAIYDKAGVYLFNIIANHIFTDGNKRTGLDAGILFLEFNDHELSPKVTNEILTDFILAVASGGHSLETVQLWLKVNIEIKI